LKIDEDESLRDIHVTGFSGGVALGLISDLYPMGMAFSTAMLAQIEDYYSTAYLCNTLPGCVSF